PGPHRRRREDREQRRRLGVQLREAEAEHERRHEQDPAADAEEPGEHSGEKPEQQHEHDRHASNLIPTASRSAANAYESCRTGMRCCSEVPPTTPSIAGIPTSAAAPGLTSPCAAYVTVPASAVTSTSPVRRRSWEVK